MNPRTRRWSPAAAMPLAVVLMLALPAVTARPEPILAAPADSKTRITGFATYLERIALTPDAVFEVTLVDVSRQDAPGEVVARLRNERPGQVPIPFQLAYDPRRIDPRGRYVVRASITEGGRRLFANRQEYPVITQGHGTKVTIWMVRASGDDREREQRGDRRERRPTLEALPATFRGLVPCADCAGIRYQINLYPDGAYMQRMTYLRDGHDDSYYELGAWLLSNDGRTLTLDGGREGSASWDLKDSNTLRKLDRAGNPIDSRLPYELTRSDDVEPMEPRLQLSGMFRYSADAARFRDCRSGFDWPVAMSDDYPALERAYGGRRAAPGSDLLVSLNGRIEQREKLDGDDTEPTLVVERFLRARPGEDCDGRTVESGLENTRWRPTRIGDRAVAVWSGQREPWIEFDPRSRRMKGSGGCNELAGGYEAGNGTLRISRVVSTMKACLSMETETSLLRALEATRRYRVHGRSLDLLDDRGRVLVQLEERNPR